MINVNSPSNRIAYIDMTRAIGILLVIALHTFGGIVLKFSLSFVMPLFFLLSGLTSKWVHSDSEYFSMIRKSAVKLLLPPVIIQMILGLINHTRPVDTLFTIIFQRCEYIHIGTFTIYPMGILWFFSALFSAKIIFCYLQYRLNSRLLPVVTVILTIAGVLLDHNRLWLPLNFDIGLAMQLFIYVGYVLTQRDFFGTITSSRAKNILALAVLVISYCLCFIITCKCTPDYLNIPLGTYPLFPLCMLTAILGSLCTLVFCHYVCRLNLPVSFIAYLGSITTFIYCLHSLDGYTAFIWNFSQSKVVVYILRCCINIVLAIIVKLAISYIRTLTHSRSKS